MEFPSLSCEMDDLVRFSAPIVPMICDPDTKRHAICFPANFDLSAQIRMCALEEEEDDDASSFIFRSPRNSKRMNRRVETVEVITPAQEIVNRYRAGLDLELDDSVSSSGSSILQEDSSEDDYIDWGVDETPSLPPSPCSAPQIRFRQSRFDVLADYRAEAMSEMHRSGVHDDHALVCPRIGCRETVNNVKALTYHLHMHDICTDKARKCGECKGRFDTPREFRYHVCTPGSNSAPTSPLYGITATFGSFLSKITSLN